MPAPNDLTPEEEQEFVNHGVQPAGPGSEPIIESNADVQAAPEELSQPDATAVSRHRPDGTFKTKEEFAAEQAAVVAQPVPVPPVDSGQPKMVPHEALHAERQRSSAAIRAAQLATTRMNAMLAAQQNRPGQAEPLPDLQDDPVGYIQGMEARLAAFEKERREETQYRQIDDGLRQDEELFSAAVPDYDAASDHFVQSRAQELLAFHTPQDAQRIMTQEARAIATQAWERGISAAQMVYQLAQARGYVPGNTAANPQNAPIPARPNGQQPQGGPSAEATVASIKAGQAASRSLSGGAGGAGVAALNAEAVLAMSEEEFEEYLGLGTKGANARFAAIG